MTFEDDALDAAYKSLESTEKFCDTSRKFFSSSQAPKFTPHQRLYRKAITADCLLFEAILVFIRQSLTSYVKGGYLIRKAWKMYEKIYNETELLCSEPSPITRLDVASPTDRHVGSSLYDDKGQSIVEEEGEEVGEEVMEGEREGGGDGEEVMEGERGGGGDREGEGDEEKFKQTMAVLGESFAMQLGIGMSDGVVGEGEGEGEVHVVQNGSGHSSTSSLSHSPSEARDELQKETGIYMYIHILYKKVYTCTCTCYTLIL